MTWGIIFFLLMGIAGVAILITGQRMKTSGKITVGWFIGQDVKMERCRDVPGFIDATYPKIMRFGTIAVVLSVLLLLLELFPISNLFNSVAELVLLIAVIVCYAIFTRDLRKATDQFLR